MRGPRNQRDLLAAIKAEGGTIERVRNGHLRVTHPNGQRRQIGCSPSQRAVINTAAHLRHIGFVLRGQP